MSGSPDPEARDELGPGARELDHTADVGIRIDAPEPAELFRRAALGLARLMRGGGRAAGDPPIQERVMTLEAPSLDRLLVRWLGELLYLDEIDGFVFEDAAFEELGPERLSATVRGRLETDVPERQIKGVTYHGLRLEPLAGGWQATVIFDI